MHIKIKNLPKLRLADLLRRRKTTLEVFILESGIQTYAALVTRCQRMGVQPPNEAEFHEIRPTIVSSPSDGVVVFEPELINVNKLTTTSDVINDQLLDVQHVAWPVWTTTDKSDDANEKCDDDHEQNDNVSLQKRRYRKNRDV